MGYGKSCICVLAVLLLLVVTPPSSVGALDVGEAKLQLSLIHKDSLQPSNVNLRQRVHDAIQSSNARLAYFASVLFSHAYSLKHGNDPVPVPAGLGTNGSFASPVYSSQGSYLMSISIGSPAKSFHVIADTGSDLFWIQCKPCRTCFKQPDPLFDTTKSSTFKKLPCSSNFCAALPAHGCSPTCEYDYQYGDGSTTHGDLATETVTLISAAGKKNAFTKFAFGCGHENKGTFSKSDGLLGLGRGQLSFTSQLGNYFGNKFSYCLVSFYDAPTKTSPIVFGDVVLPPSTKFQYTPLISNPVNPTFYYVGVEGIAVDNINLDIPKGAFDIDIFGYGGLILDSGTTLCYLIPEAYDPLLKQVRTLMSKYTPADGSAVGLDLCVNLNGVQDPEFPDITFQFTGLSLSLPGANSFLSVDDEGTTCLAFLSSNFGFSIFGNVQQQNFIVQHDLAKSQVGFAPAQCDTIG